MTQHRRTWQRHEQKLAEHFGTARKRSGEPGADVVTSWVAVECKSWSRLPARVVAALRQAEACATDDQLPIAVLHEVNARHDDDLVIMRWADFEKWYGGPHGTQG